MVYWFSNNSLNLNGNKLLTGKKKNNNFHDRIRQRDPRVKDTPSPLYPPILAFVPPHPRLCTPHPRLCTPTENRKKTKQRSVKARMLFMTKTRCIKTFATASEACVSHVVADAHFHRCHLVCTVGGGGLLEPPETCFQLVQCFTTPTGFRKTNSAT